MCWETVCAKTKLVNFWAVIAARGGGAAECRGTLGGRGPPGHLVSLQRATLQPTYAALLAPYYPSLRRPHFRRAGSGKPKNHGVRPHAGGFRNNVRGELS